MHSGLCFRTRSPGKTYSVGVASGKQPGSGSAADRLSGKEMGELHTLTGKPVDIRRRVTVSPVAGEITVPDIIQIHQDDVYIISLLFRASAQRKPCRGSKQ